MASKPPQSGSGTIGELIVLEIFGASCMTADCLHLTCSSKILGKRPKTITVKAICCNIELASSRQLTMSRLELGFKLLRTLNNVLDDDLTCTLQVTAYFNLEHKEEYVTTL
ncbi:hypothetical protein IEQ34_003763 [Dendrobium chrysotoxum]|uniref:Uncharacterized protein n=1 Tax=Dendrobium chrysotoxum TaxID=161865 RepID=A0AAV7HEG4_DENCH|nr:hypothetical protein IEQ34_003763 [Dendrobium chrysotoxum]